MSLDKTKQIYAVAFLLKAIIGQKRTSTYSNSDHDSVLSLILLLDIEIKPFYCLVSFAASTSAFSIIGGSAKSSVAFAMSAAAMGPAR